MRLLFASPYLRALSFMMSSTSAFSRTGWATHQLLHLICRSSTMVQSSSSQNVLCVHDWPGGVPSAHSVEGPTSCICYIGGFFRDKCPTFQLEDKLVIEGGKRDVMWGHPYSRKRRARDIRCAKERAAGSQPPTSGHARQDIPTSG